MDKTVQHGVAEAREHVLARIAAAAKRAGRDPADVELIAVSKLQPEDRIDAMLATGQRLFGENRVQEADGRWSHRRATLPGLELHLIGPLQTNKVQQAVGLFDVIQTLDREKLAASVSAACAKAGRQPRLYVQVNTGAEEQKSGILPEAADAFIARVRGTYGLVVEGLMCIPPVGEPAGPHFALLARIAARNGLVRLSMGMSGDYETAILFGATCVRVGSALFGDRPHPDASAAGGAGPS